MNHFHTNIGGLDLPVAISTTYIVYYALKVKNSVSVQIDKTHESYHGLCVVEMNVTITPFWLLLYWLHWRYDMNKHPSNIIVEFDGTQTVLIIPHSKPRSCNSCIRFELRPNSLRRWNAHEKLLPGSSSVCMRTKNQAHEMGARHINIIAFVCICLRVIRMRRNVCRLDAAIRSRCCMRFPFANANNPLCTRVAYANTQPNSQTAYNIVVWRR